MSATAHSRTARACERRWLLEALHTLPALEQCALAAIHFPEVRIRTRSRSEFARDYDFTDEEVTEVERRGLELLARELLRHG